MSFNSHLKKIIVVHSDWTNRSYLNPAPADKTDKVETLAKQYEHTYIHRHKSMHPCLFAFLSNLTAGC
jgi:hypothetical protein